MARRNILPVLSNRHLGDPRSIYFQVRYFGYHLGPNNLCLIMGFGNKYVLRWDRKRVNQYPQGFASLVRNVVLLESRVNRLGPRYRAKPLPVHIVPADRISLVALHRQLNRSSVQLFPARRHQNTHDILLNFRKSIRHIDNLIPCARQKLYYSLMQDSVRDKLTYVPHCYQRSRYRNQTDTSPSKYYYCPSYSSCRQKDF